MEVPEATSGHLVPLGMFYFYSFSLLLQLLSHTPCMRFPLVLISF